MGLMGIFRKLMKIRKARIIFMKRFYCDERSDFYNYNCNYNFVFF